MMLYSSIDFIRTENGYEFFNDTLKLCFAADGNLNGITFTDTTIPSMTLTSPEISMYTGGYYKSSVDTEHINKNWAHLSPVDMETVVPTSEYVGHRLVKTRNTVVLHLTVKLSNGLMMDKQYSLRSGVAGFERSFALTNTGDRAVTVRSVNMAFPKAENEKTACKAASPTIVTLGEKFLAGWFDPRYAACGLDGMLQYNEKVENTLAVGDSYQSCSVRFELRGGDVYEVASYVRDRLEEAGLRGHRENLPFMQSIVAYEVEIGPLRLSETKCHHRYDHPSELAADLERIRDLGFNTVEMMPSFLFPCYTVYDLKNPDVQNGNGESIRPIIEKAHALGMKVILDILMHGCIDTEIAEWDLKTYCSRRYYWPEWLKRIPELFGEERGKVNPIREEHPDWFIYEKPGEIFKGYTWTFDHANVGFQEYFAEAMEISVTDWNVDGFRFDAPTWQSGVNSAENLPYSGAESVNGGHCELFRKTRERLDKLGRDIIFIVEGPYYQYSDNCDMSYAYDLYSFYRNIANGKTSARDLQKYCHLRSCSYPVGACWFNFFDNHDTWNNGVTEDGLYASERYGRDKTIAFAAAVTFGQGGVQSFGGFEENDPIVAAELKRLLTVRRNNAAYYNTSADYSDFSCDERIFRIIRRNGISKLCMEVNFSSETVDGIAPYCYRIKNI